MDQQITQLYVGVAHIGAKHVLTEEVIKLPPGRMLFEKRAVLMPGASKSAVAHRNILAQGVEERRQQILFVTAGGRLQFQELLRFSCYYSSDTFRNIRRLLREHKYRKLKARTFQQRKDAATAFSDRNDHCRHIGKISVIQRHHFPVSRHSRDQLAADGNFHGFHRRSYPHRAVRQGGENSRNNVTFYF